MRYWKWNFIEFAYFSYRTQDIKWLHIFYDDYFVKVGHEINFYATFLRNFCILMTIAKKNYKLSFNVHFERHLCEKYSDINRLIIRYSHKTHRYFLYHCWLWHICKLIIFTYKFSYNPTVSLSNFVHSRTLITASPLSFLNKFLIAGHWLFKVLLLSKMKSESSCVCCASARNLNGMCSKLPS